MIGMGSVVTRDVPPFAKAFGNPAHVRGANIIGMTRGGVSRKAIDAVSELYSSPTPDSAPLASIGELAELYAAWIRR